MDGHTVREKDAIERKWKEIVDYQSCESIGLIYGFNKTRRNKMPVWVIYGLNC